MTRRTLLIRSLRHHWRAHLGVVLGATVGSAALIGALVVGDSVRGSLRDRALERLGRIQFAIQQHDRFFSDTLADDISGSVSALRTAGSGGEAGGKSGAADALILPGLAVRQDATARANRVNVIGVDGGPAVGGAVSATSFGELSLVGSMVSVQPGAVWLNAALAAQLKARPGDELVMRLLKPGLLSADAPIAPRSDNSVALRLRVAGVRGAAALGDFSLRPSQSPPWNAFVNLTELQRAVDLPGRANLLVSSAENPELLATELRRQVRLKDFDLEVRGAPANAAEVISRRIFLEPALVRAAGLSISGQDTAGPGSKPAGAAGVPPALPNAQPLLTYLVNLLRAGTNNTPYSMITAAPSPWTPADLRDDEIMVNQWLADDLQVKPGDMIETVYFLPESGARLLEATNRFRLRGIVPLVSPWADRTLMPEFPGLAKAESTHDWDAGFPLVHKIRDKDEAYWKQHRGTPKAFVSLAAGRKLWANRFGDLTAIRFPQAADAGTNGIRLLEEQLLAALVPADFGLRFEPVRVQALAAADQAQDFGQLFLGFSFFLIVAALILTALLFQFGVEQRAAEIGTMLALGFAPGQVRRLFLREGLALAMVGSLFGAAAGLGYAWLMLRGLTTIWRDAVSTAALSFHAEVGTLGVGMVGSVICSALALWLALRRQARQPARKLLAGTAGDESHGGGRSGVLRTLWLGGGATVAALVLVGWAILREDASAAGAFFGAGALLLVGGLAFSAAWLARLTGLTAAGRGKKVARKPGATADSAGALSLGSLSVRALARRRSRSLAVAGLLACGSFLVVAIGAFRQNANLDAWQRSAGTGGFAFAGETALPVTQDLDTASGREFYGFDEAALFGVRFVAMRLREGDDASCLNLNRAQRPRLLGVKPELLAQRGAFTFAKLLGDAAVGRGWQLLSGNARQTGVTGQPTVSSDSAGKEEIVVPAIGDLNSITWAMGRRVGDTLDYVDERGQPFKVLIVGAVANSILQGSLLIAEEEFVKRFPGDGGYRKFLVDAPSNRLDSVSAELSRAMQDVGLELVPAVRQLASFNGVQNTYLNTFQVLGALGLLLGSAGLGVVVLRNVLERRGELALLLAIGFRPRLLRRLVLSEHSGLLLLGLGIGLLAATLAILPAGLAPGAEVEYRSLALMVAGIFVSGLVWAWLATSFALHGRLLDALRNE